MRLKNNEALPRKRRRAHQHKIWHTFVQVYKEFASESTVHGIKYTTQAKTTLERLLWLMVVIISLISAGQLASKFYQRHESGNMRTTVVTNQYPSLKIAIPAVTICQGYLVSTERLQPFLDRQKRLFIPPGLSMKDFVDGLHYLREIVSPSNSYSAELDKLQRIVSVNRLRIPDILNQLSPNCSDLLLMCIYDGQTKDCNELFVPTITSYGICCSFNYVADNNDRETRNDEEEHLYTTKFGSRYLLSVLLKPYNTSDRIASITFGDGYKVLVHEKYTVPGPNALEFMAGAGHETIIGLHSSYLTSSAEVLNLPAAQRDCKALRKDFTYRSENCYINCRTKAILGLCNCLPFYATKNQQSDDVLCNLTHIACLARIISETYSLTLRDPQCDCLPDCENTKYAAAITGEPFRAAQFKPGSFYEMAQSYENSSALHITFGGQAAVLERRELVLSWINLVSSLGGVFSLFLGCSFISIIEFFYFFFFQLVRKLKKQYKKSSTVINSR